MLQNTRLFSLFPFFLVFYEITNYLANDMYLPALPHIVADLNTTTHLAQQTLTTWFFGTASLQLLLGPLSDRLGRRPILLGGGIIFVISSLACALSPNIHVLLIARFFQGCAIGSIVTAGYSCIHELYEQIKAIQILAIMGSITVLAPAFGPLFGAVILNWFSWRWIFGALVIWAVIALSALWFAMPETNPRRKVEEGGKSEKLFRLDWKSIFKNYKSILLNKTFILNTLIFCFTFLGMIAWIAAGPFLVISQFKLSTFMFGIFQVLVFSTLILGAQVVKHFIHRIGPQRFINIGLLIVILGGSLAFILTLFFPSFLLGLVISLMIFTFGSSLAFGPSHRLAVEACSEPMGARMAIFSTLMALFGVLGGLLVSFTYNGTLFWFGCLLLIIASGAWLLRWMERRNSGVSTAIIN